MGFQFMNAAKKPMDDEQIIELYWERDERAIEETDLKYKKHLFSIAYNIVRDKQDCEECLNDTYLGAWNAIPPSKPGALRAFLTIIARRIAIKRYHSYKRKKSIPAEMTVSLSELEDFVADGDDVDSDFDAKRLGEILSAFLHRLPKRQRLIFVGRYYMAESIDSIANALQLSRSTVNKELAAIRKLLQEKLESEGYLL